MRSTAQYGTVGHLLVSKLEQAALKSRTVVCQNTAFYLAQQISFNDALSEIFKTAYDADTGCEIVAGW